MVKNIFKKIYNISFGDKIIDLGEPIRTDYQGAFEYFDHVYKSSSIFIQSLVQRLQLYNKKIVSIGSGFGAEEILLSQFGDNYIDCIEPDSLSRKVCNYFLNKFGIKKIHLYNTSVHFFNQYEKKFDLIYSSSPSDWMHSDFRQIIPERYITFFNTFGRDNSFIVLKLYGGTYDSFVLRSGWFLKSFNKKLKEKTTYNLIEYWLNTSGEHATIIASNFITELPENSMFKFCSQRNGNLSVLKYKFNLTGDLKWHKYEKIVPYFLALRKLIKAIRKKFTGKIILLNIHE